MRALLDAVTATGIIFALGHFYFALVYDAKKYGSAQTSILAFVSVLFTGGWYLLLWDIPSAGKISLFSLSVLIAFLLHSLFDLWRFGYRWIGMVTSIAGFFFLYLYFWHRSGDLYGIVASFGIWLVVFFHYLFWIFISVKRFAPDESEKFIRDTVAIHVAIALGYLGNIASSDRSAGVAYVLPFFFYFATLFHVIFSAFRQLIRAYNKNRKS
ncbi:MAG: hypothetical protein E6R05_02720 [Candidatus Moraniibacteriota bacterium]|nr:MAG: hypothetical protein E6R05_02720 [Candidatus Moranbacteria bacterium]